jgi:hypothetical protein
MVNERFDGEESRLDELWREYREACPECDCSPNFMPELWARIEARETSSNWFGRMAKTLVTAALAASVVLGMLISWNNQPAVDFNGTYVEALAADHVSALEPLHLDRISQLEQH